MNYIESNTPGYQFLARALLYEDIVNPLDKVKIKVRERPLTAYYKSVTYRTAINPELCVLIPPVTLFQSTKDRLLRGLD